MTNPLVIPTLVTAVACAALVAAEYRHARTAKAIAKTIASLSFVAVALLGLTSCEPPVPAWGEYQRYIIIGLVLGVAGDIALLGRASAAFLAGLGAFLLGHIAYVIAFAQLAPPRAWLAPIALAPLVAGGAVLAYLWPRLGSMRVAVIAYVIAIVTMMAAAIAAAGVTDIPVANRALLVVGAALFFASDFAVARDRFVGASFINRAWGLPAYYAGQLLIAWSVSIPACG